jgi:hypothetical protein
LGTQARKLQLPVPLEYQVVSTSPTKLELPNRWVPKPELGNQPLTEFSDRLLDRSQGIEKK